MVQKSCQPVEVGSKNPIICKALGYIQQVVVNGISEASTVRLGIHWLEDGGFLKWWYRKMDGL